MAVVCCSPATSCDALGNVTIGLYVVDVNTKQPICEPAVSVESSADPNVTAPGYNCGFVTLNLPNGSFEVSVAATGHANVTQRITVRTDECGRQHIAPDGPRDGLPGYGNSVTVGLAPQ